MTAAAVDPLAHVFARVQRVLGAGAEDSAVAVLTRFLTGGEPAWLRTQPDHVRLDVLTVHDVLARRRSL